jgi:hypothetical protein
MVFPGDPLGGALTAFPPVSGLTQYDFNTNPDFRNAGVTKDAVSSAVIDSVQVKITAPSTQDFSFLDNLQLLAAATGRQAAVIAQKSSIRQLNLRPPNPTLTLDTTGAQLKPYVTAPNMSILVQGSGNAPPNDTTISITLGMEVDVSG